MDIVYHDGEYGGPVEAAGQQSQTCKHLAQAWTWLTVVPEVMLMRTLVKMMIKIMMVTKMMRILVNMMNTIMMVTKRGGRKHLVAVKRRDEKERRMARSSPQAAAQAQEGGPAKLLPLFNIT